MGPQKYTIISNITAAILNFEVIHKNEVYIYI